MTSCVHFATRDDETRKAEEAEGGDLFMDATAAAVRRYRLTSREAQVLEALLRGRERAQIADGMGVSLATVKWHLHNVYGKLDVEDSEATLRKALFLDDPRWLHAPLQHRDALERLIDVAEQVVRVGKTDRRTRLDGALARLERELAAVRLKTGLDRPDESVVGDEQVEVAVPSPRQLELPGSRS